MTTTSDLLAERGGDYKDAWLVHASVVKDLYERGYLNRVLRTNVSFCWMMCLNKMIREMGRSKDDNWADCAGYATLAASVSISKRRDVGGPGVIRFQFPALVDHNVSLVLAALEELLFDPLNTYLWNDIIRYCGRGEGETPYGLSFQETEV